LIFDLEAEQDTDHVIAIFKARGHWGAVAKSNFTGCRYREPVYRSLRELAMSYFNIYFNLRGERTLRRYSRLVNLARFDDRTWMTTEKPIWFIAEYLCEIPHISLLTPAIEKNLTRLDRRDRPVAGRDPDLDRRSHRAPGRQSQDDLGRRNCRVPRVEEAAEGERRQLPLASAPPRPARNAVRPRSVPVRRPYPGRRGCRV